MINYVYHWFLYFYCLSSVLIQVNGNYISFYNILNRVKRGTKKCDGFRCITSGKCLEIEKRCDGKVDCEDGSDEFNNCRNEISCPDYLFTCEYGACLDTNKVCDGEKDCRDNSDENNCKNKTKRSIPISIRPPTNIRPPTYIESCKLPDYPENGRWIISGVNNTLYGSKVKIGTILTFICDQQYKLSSKSNFLTCLNDREWSATPPKCLKFCPSLLITAETEVTCYDESKIDEIKCNTATTGSIARFSCASYYELDNEKAKTALCWDGVWTSPPPQCIPVCGKIRIPYRPQIENTTQIVEKVLYPWVTAVYRNVSNMIRLVCGGSMLSQRIILTAAHCVTDEIGGGINPATVKIGVGKYYNGYKDTRDTLAQYSDILKIVVHGSYRGESQRYASDIACLITTDKLYLSIVVQPVCYLNLPHIHLTTNMEGVISGWGYTLSNRSISDELKNVLIPYDYSDNCTVERYYTYDKICAGNYNKSIVTGKGDSGGGLVFENNGRYYVHGILSVGETSMSNHAAHCVTDEFGIGVNPEKAKIGVEKSYNGHKDTRDTLAQYSDILKIVVHGNYRGESEQYASDIASLITTDKLYLSMVVQPVCYLNLPHIHLTTNMEGVLSGWGYTLSRRTISEELKTIVILYEDYDTCSATLSKYWLKRYYTYDKICAGNYNQSRVVGNGDSGGGIVFPHNGRYYVHGILSNSATEVLNHGLYSNVSTHYNWLEQVVAQYRKNYKNRL